MVSFSCEDCGDVLTKKKLDPHRNRCRGSAYTCLDCMVTFRGSEHQSHTSCMTEAQKYQGSSRREARQKNGSAGRPAYVEDALDPDDSRVAIVDAPPHAPSPPPPLSTPHQAALPPVNVFDFLVNDQTPVANKVIAPPPDDSRMIEDAPQPMTYPHQTRLVEPETPGAGLSHYDMHYIENGYSYGTEPVAPSLNRYASFVDITQTASLRDAEAQPSARFRPSDEHRTPAPKADRERNRDRVRSREDGGEPRTKSDRKRKRHPIEELDLSLDQRTGADAIMTDAPPLLHSGLTGGLNRLLARPDFPPSPDYSGGDGADPSPVGALVHTKQSRTDRAERERARERRKERSRREESRKTSGESRRGVVSTTVAGAEAGRATREEHRASRRREHRRERDGEGDREAREKRHHGHRRRRRSSSPTSRTTKVLKAIEYPRIVSPSHSHGSGEHATGAGQLILRENRADTSRALQLHSQSSAAVGDEHVASRAQLFLAFVNKGPESTRGCSMNKALKRWHRERGERASGSTAGASRKVEDEKELWRSLRLRRNDRGEIVVFI